LVSGDVVEVRQDQARRFGFVRQGLVPF